MLLILKFRKVFYIWTKTKTIENLFLLFDIFSALLPIFFFIRYWKSSIPETGLRIVFAYAILIFIINVLSNKYRDSSFLFESFTVVESIAFIGFLFLQIQNPRLKKASLIVGGAFLLFNFIYPYFTKEKEVVDSVPIGVETIIIMVFSFYALYEKTNDATTLYIYNTSFFWIVIGMVLYLSGSFFVYLLVSFMKREEMLKYWVLTNALAVLKNIFFSIAIIVNSKPVKTLSSPDFKFGSLN